MAKYVQVYGRFGFIVCLLVIWASTAVLNLTATGSALKPLPSNKNFHLLSVPQSSTQTFKVDGIERTALVFSGSVPSPKTGAPLVFAFHGHGGNSQFSARKFRIHQEWPEAVVIYPQGLPAAGMYDPEGKKNGWQKSAGDLGDRDLKFFDVLLEWAKKQYKIDTSRIYVAGHSNGGAMTYVLWSARSNVIAAFAPCAAGFGRGVLSAKPKPAILLAGEHDEVVPFENQKRSMNLVLRLNQCDINGIAQGKEETFYKSKIGADIIAYIYPGGHPLPENAGEVIVKFFKQYSLK